MSVTGLPGQGPVRVGIPVADLCAGLFCALGILTALHEREVSGEGQWVSTSLLQAQIFMLDFQASRFLTDGVVSKQAGNNHPTSIPTGVFKTSDGHLNIAVAGAGDLGAFLQRGRPSEWIASADYKTGKLRLQNRDKLNAEIDKATANKSSAEWVEIFNIVGVPCGPIYSIDQVFADPQVKHLGIAQECRAFRRQPARLGWPAVQAVAYAEQDRSAAAEPGRAHRRDSHRIRFWRRGNQGAARVKSSLRSR